MKESYIEILKKYRSHLECSRNKFNILEKMNFDRLEKDNGNTWMVEATLEKIVNYALIIQGFDLYELDLIEDTASCFGNKEAYQEASQVLGACHDLVMDAIDNDCRNPMFLVFKDLVDSYDLYEELIEGMCYYIEKINDDDSQQQVLSLIDNVDTLVIDVNDRTLSIIINLLRTKIDSKTILTALSEIAKARFMTHLLIGEGGIYTIDNIMVKKPVVSYIDVCNDVLAKIFMKMNDYGFFNDDAKNRKLNELNRGYQLFKSYQYDYLKNRRISDRMIEKCK